MASKLTLAVGIIFLVLGILGLVGGVGLVGSEGIFLTNLVQDLIHLVSGLVLILVATRSPAGSSAALIVFGIIYLVVAILGFFSGDNNVIGILMNDAVNYLHAVIGLIMFIFGLVTRSPSNRI